MPNARISSKMYLKQPTGFTIFSDESIDEKLQFQFALYRINLRSAFAPRIQLNEWHRVHLLLVNELGLFRRVDMEPCGELELSCEIVEFEQEVGEKDGRSIRGSYKVDIRPLQAEPFLDQNAADIPGFQGSGKGGFEYRIIRASHSNAVNGVRNGEVNGLKGKNRINGTNGTRAGCYPVITTFISIFPTPTKEHSVQAMPLVIGPISVTDTGIKASTIGTEGFHRAVTASTYWDTDESIYEIRRQFPVLLSDPRRCLLVRELWEDGIPGKVWDSACILTRYFQSLVDKDKTFLAGKHILDLSAGTGFVGLYIAALATVSNPRGTTCTTKITITDVPQALSLIRSNYAFNSHLLPHEAHSTPNIQIRPLTWGRTEEAAVCGVPDIILASDVVYETLYFSDLIHTLRDLCLIGKTAVYLGYKRRGLEIEEEEQFFNLCKEWFDVNMCIEGSTVGGIAARTGVTIFRLVRRV